MMQGQPKPMGHGGHGYVQPTTVVVAGGKHHGKHGKHGKKFKHKKHKGKFKKFKLKKFF